MACAHVGAADVGHGHSHDAFRRGERERLGVGGHERPRAGPPALRRRGGQPHLDAAAHGALEVLDGAERTLRPGRGHLDGVAVEQPGTDAVKAMFPIVPAADVYRDVTWAGGNTDAGFIPLWLGLVNGLAMIPGPRLVAVPLRQNESALRGR